MKDIDGNYIKEFDAKVTQRAENYIVLDRSAFSPLGGCQPSDTGYIVWQDRKSRVVSVEKKGIIRHIIEGELPEGEVYGIIDWERRYAHMKMYTSQHVISGVVFDIFNARTVGNQIHPEESRVDFHPLKLCPEDLNRIEAECNAIIEKNANVRIYEELRSNLEKK